MNDKNTFYLPRQTPYFCLKRLKIKDLRDLERDLYPCCTPILKILLTGLPSIKMNITFDERSSAWDFFLIPQECRFECRFILK